MTDSLELQVAASFLSGLQNAAQGCINGLPSINGDAASTVMTNQYNKCCPVIKAVCLLSRVLAANTLFPQCHWHVSGCVEVCITPARQAK